MSLLQKIKENISKRGKEVNEEYLVEIPSMHQTFIFYGNNWVVAPFMSEIFKGRIDLIPIECVLTMYILRCYNMCYYIVLDNNNTGDDFSVYEFEWIGADGEREHCANKEKHEDTDPEFIEYATNMTALDAGKFLRDKIDEGYYIYIQERL